uniref:Uncharacterized protein n=1 Tax=Rhizophora mucronata TaxID=61149 RepID=A0A2P2P3S3_RHIMU
MQIQFNSSTTDTVVLCCFSLDYIDFSQNDLLPLLEFKVTSRESNSIPVLLTWWGFLLLFTCLHPIFPKLAVLFKLPVVFVLLLVLYVI